MHDVDLAIQTIDIQELSEDEFGPTLRRTQLSQEKINLIILEGREAPKDISDRYIQVVLANINRFARNKRVPLLVVIPTVDEQVARNWCDHASKIGDLIPEQQLYEGSRWYNFPGVPKGQYIEIASKTVRALNPSYDVVQFGVDRHRRRSNEPQRPLLQHGGNRGEVSWDSLGIRDVMEGHKH